jgi:hypothetical protein
MPDIIKTQSALVEEDILLIPESLRFESEPWTPFYVAGEIIRESRKASGEQSKYASERNTARSDELVDHARATSPTEDPDGASAWSAFESM